MRFVLLFAVLAIAKCELETIFCWKEMEYNFPNESYRNVLMESGNYIPANNLPIGINVWKEKFFVTVPRWKKGVLSTLNYIPMSEITNKVKAPKLMPYPNIEMNDIRTINEDTIISIFRFKIDACDRLWALDTGMQDILGEAHELRPAQIIIIDLKTDKIIRKYPLKSSDKKDESFFASIEVDVDKNRCEDAFAYIPDFTGYGLVVYQFSTNNSWRVNHNFFYFDPLHGDYNVSGINFHWTDGVFGVAVADKKGVRTLYFHAMSGITEFSIPVSILQNETLATSNNYQYFHVEGSKGPFSQGPTMVFDDMKVGYFAQINRHAVACWDSTLPLNTKNFHTVLDDKCRLIFPNDLTLSSNKLFVLSSNVPKYQVGDLDKEEENYFVTAESLESLHKRCKHHTKG